MRLTRDDPGLPLYHTENKRGQTFRRIRARARNVSLFLSDKIVVMHVIAVVRFTEYCDQGAHHCQHLLFYFCFDEIMQWNGVENRKLSD